MKCKSCHKETVKQIDNLCMKCYMMSRTDKDRRGRYSRKDKHGSKQERERMY